MKKIFSLFMLFFMTTSTFAFDRILKQYDIIRSEDGRKGVYLITHVCVNKIVYLHVEYNAVTIAFSPLPKDANNPTTFVSCR